MIHVCQDGYVSDIRSIHLQFLPLTVLVFSTIKIKLNHHFKITGMQNSRLFRRSKSVSTVLDVSTSF